MLNVDSKLKIKSTEQVDVLPSGLDIDFYVSFHDNFGNEFDAVQSNILLESNQKVKAVVLLIIFNSTKIVLLLLLQLYIRPYQFQTLTAQKTAFVLRFKV